MKRNLIALVTLVASIYAFSQKIDLADTIYFDKNWNECSKQQHKYYHLSEATNIKYFDTILIRINDYYKSGILQMTGYISPMNPEKYLGLFKYYRKNGTLKTIHFYDLQELRSSFEAIEQYLILVNLKDSIQAYLFISFFPDGHINQIGFQFDACMKTGYWVEYNPFNKEIKTTFTYKDGILNGISRIYYYEKMFYEMQYKEDMLNGYWKKFNYNGELVKERIYRNGVIVNTKKHKR